MDSEANSAHSHPDGPKPLGYEDSYPNGSAGTGTNPRLRRQRFYAVADGDHKGVYNTYAEIQLRHSKAVAFPSQREAQVFIDEYQLPVRTELDACDVPG